MMFLGELILGLVFSSVCFLTLHDLLTVTQKCGKTYLKYIMLFSPDERPCRSRRKSGGRLGTLLPV